MIIPACSEWVLLSEVYHHVLEASPSPERAKIDIGAARKDGRLRFRAERHEHVAMPGEQPPKKNEPIITSDQPLPKDPLCFDTWDWERSRAITRNDANTQSVFEYVDIVVHRDDVLALWPTAPVAPAVPAPTATAMPQLHATRIEQAIDPFRTGAPGRPTAIDFIVAEAERRISSREVIPRSRTLARFARELFDWYEQERRKFPTSPAATSHTIENFIRDLWRSSLADSGEDKI
jgi:hypothetical protein